MSPLLWDMERLYALVRTKWTWSISDGEPQKRNFLLPLGLEPASLGWKTKALPLHYINFLVVIWILYYIYVYYGSNLNDFKSEFFFIYALFINDVQPSTDFWWIYASIFWKLLMIIFLIMLLILLMICTYYNEIFFFSTVLDYWWY